METKKREMTPREIMESDSYIENKFYLVKEINEPVVKIDYRVFRKTQIEKERLKEHKLINIEERRKYYGDNYKDFLNIPSKSIETIRITN